MEKLPPISDFIAASEGFSAVPYKCEAGFLTIGYGRNLDSVGLRKEEITYFANKYGTDHDEDAIIACFNRGIDKVDALYLLNNDISAAKSDIKRVIPYFGQLPSKVQYVCIDVIFNIGFHKFKKFNKMITALGSYHVQGKPEALDEAAVELLHCGPKGYLFDVKTRAVRNAKLLANDFVKVKRLLASRPGTAEHMKFINQYGGK